MKHLTKRTLSVLIAMVMVLSVVALSGLRVNAAAPAANISSEDKIDPATILYTFTADDFQLPYSPDNGDGVYEDADSSTGKAAVLSYEKRAATGDKGMTNALVRSGEQTLNIFSQGDPYVEVGAISIAQLNELSQRGGYTLFQFRKINLMPNEGDYFIYIFDCWGFQLRFNDEQKAALRNKEIDFYLSLKLTGNVGDPVDNPPTYYIDKIIITEADLNAPHEHTFGGWTVDSEKHIRSCSECGEIQNGPHQWDEGVVTKEASTTADGEKVYTCTDCAKTKTEVLPRIDNTEEPGDVEPKPADNTGLIIAIIAVVAVIGIAVVIIVIKKNKK